MTCAGVVALLVTGACSKSSSGPQGTIAVNQSGSNVDVDVSYSNRQDFISRMKDESKDIKAEIERLQVKATNAADNSAAAAKTKLQELKEKSSNLDVQIDKAQNATESTWNDVKASSRKAMDEAKNSFQDAKDWLSEKWQSATSSSK
jgi:hypothetical protein